MINVGISLKREKGKNKSDEDIVNGSGGKSQAIESMIKLVLYVAVLYIESIFLFILVVKQIFYPYLVIMFLLRILSFASYTIGYTR